MRALVAHGDGSVALEEVAEPLVGPEERLVRPVACGLCGTDLELVDATIDPDYVRYPLVLGHEWVGRDEAGRLVVVEGIIPCGQCDACHRGATNLCATYDEVGFTRPGAVAPALSVPAHLIHPLGHDVDPLDAVLTEPMAVVWRALRRAAPPAGARCLVVGDGTVALLAALLLARFEPAHVDMLGLRSSQSGLAAQAGVRRFLETDEGESYDLVIEAAGHVDAVAQALRSVGRGGTILLLGLPPHGATVPVAPDRLVNDDLTILASFSYTRAAWAEVVDLLNQGLVHPGFLVTHRFALEQWSDALATLRDRAEREPRGKVLIEIPSP